MEKEGARMPRGPREIAPGEYYHILSRGNNKQTLFYEPADFGHYLRTLGRYQSRYRILIFHYCLMTNHVHLILRSDHSRQVVTKFMHGTQLAYARYFAARYRTTGHVFEDRFKHFHIDSEAYLLECGRYIERNPVRAKIVKDPKDYPWSSYRFYAYGEADGLVTANPLYEPLGRTQAERQGAYRDYVEPPRPYETIVDRYFDERVLL